MNTFWNASVNSFHMLFFSSVNCVSFSFTILSSWNKENEKKKWKKQTQQNQTQKQNKNILKLPVFFSYIYAVQSHILSIPVITK